MASHETLALRLTMILLRLSGGEAVDRASLAAEFGVTERTIYRDLNRLGAAVECMDDGRYRLVRAAPAKAGSNAGELLAALGLSPTAAFTRGQPVPSGVHGDVFKLNGSRAELIPVGGRSFSTLAQAVAERCVITVRYHGRARTLWPYRLVHQGGVWYLAATESGQLRSYVVSKIEGLSIDGGHFVADPHVVNTISDEDDIWYGSERFDVRLLVGADAARFFLTRRLVPQQEVTERHLDGSLVVRSTPVHARQIAPIVRAWIPHVRVLEPAWLVAELDNELRAYLDCSQ